MKAALLYVLLVLLLLFRISQEESAYQVPDSLLYLEMAESAGEPTGYVPHAGATALYPFQVREVPFSLFPYGYPLLIRLVHELSGLNLLSSSKLLNMLLLAACFWWFHKRYSSLSWMPLALFFGAALLLVFSSTMSEAPFVLFLLLWISSYEKLIRAKEVKLSDALLLLGLSAALYLCRYVGVFLLPVYAVLAAYFFYTKERDKAFITLGIGVAFAAVVAAYFLINQELTGFASGISRIFIEPWKYLLVVIGDASLNELFFYKRWYMVFEPLPGGFILTLLVQLALMLALFFVLQHRKQVWNSILLHPLWLPAIAFYLTITSLRVLSPFLYDLRTLMPLELLVWIIAWDSILAENAVNKKLKPVMVAVIGVGVVAGLYYL